MKFLLIVLSLIVSSVSMAQAYDDNDDRWSCEAVCYVKWGNFWGRSYRSFHLVAEGKTGSVAILKLANLCTKKRDILARTYEIRSHGIVGVNGRDMGRGQVWYYEQGNVNMKMNDYRPTLKRDCVKNY